MINNYCKVCKNYDWRGYCKMGWDSFCDKKSFIPSPKTTILNFICLLSEYGDFSEKILDELENLVHKYYPEE